MTNKADPASVDALRERLDAYAHLASVPGAKERGLRAECFPDLFVLAADAITSLEAARAGGGEAVAWHIIYKNGSEALTLFKERAQNAANRGNTVRPLVYGGVDRSALLALLTKLTEECGALFPVEKAERHLHDFLALYAAAPAQEWTCKQCGSHDGQINCTNCGSWGEKPSDRPAAPAQEPWWMQDIPGDDPRADALNSLWVAASSAYEEAAPRHQHGHAEWISRMQAAIRVLLTAAPAQPTGWRPIESAPHDKTRVALLHVGDEGRYRRYGTGYYMPLDGWQGWEAPFDVEPTHWHPLPEPPK